MFAIPQIDVFFISKPNGLLVCTSRERLDEIFHGTAEIVFGDIPRFSLPKVICDRTIYYVPDEYLLSPPKDEKWLKVL